MNDKEQADIVARVARAQAQVKGQVQQTQASTVTKAQVNTNNVSSGSLRQVGTVTQNTSSTSTTTSSIPDPVATRVGSATYYDVNSVMQDLYRQATASGVPNVPRPPTDMRSYTDKASAQKAIDAYYAKIPVVYNVNDALQKAYNEAVAKGIPGVPQPKTYQSKFTDSTLAQKALDSYTASIPPTYDVNTAIQQAYNEAVAKGIPVANIPKPTTTSTVYVDKAKADAYVKSYTDQIPPTYDVNSAIQAAYDEAVAKGIPTSSLQKPTSTSTVYIDKAAADAFVKAYTDSIPPTYDVNSAVQSAYDAAVKAGIPASSMPKPTTTSTVYIDKSKADAYVKSYTDKIPATYDVNSAVKAAYDAAKASGIPVSSLPSVPTTTKVFTSKSEADAYVKSYTDKMPVTYDVNTAVQTAANEAKAAGYTSIPAVPTTTQVFTDKASADAYVKAYTDKLVPPASSVTTTTTYDVSTALKSVQAEAKAAGITNIPALPTTGTYTSQAAAQKVVDDYVAKVNASAQTTTSVQATSAPAYDINKDPNALNQYKMTQAEWNQYQADVASIPMADRPGPSLWMYENHNPKVPDLPLNNQYVYVGGGFVPDSYQTQSLKDQMALNASKVYNVDPQQTGGYKFAQELNDDNSSKYLKAVQSNPSLTEYQWRQQNAGRDNGGSPIDLAAVPGDYAKPAVVGNSFSSSNASIGTVKVISSTGVDITSKSTPQSSVKSITPVVSSAKIDTSGANVKVISASGADVTSQRTPQTIVSTQKATSSNISASKIDTSGASVKVITTSGADVTSQRTPQSIVATQKSATTNASANISSTPKIISAAALSSNASSSNVTAVITGNSQLAKYNRSVATQATKTGMDTVVNASGALSTVAKQTTPVVTKQTTPSLTLITSKSSNSLSPLINTSNQDLTAQSKPQAVAQTTQANKSPTLVSQNTGWSSILGDVSDLVTKGEHILGSAVSVGQKTYSDLSKVVGDNVNAFTSNFDNTVSKDNKNVDNSIVSTVNSYLGNAGKSLDNYVSSVITPSTSSIVSSSKKKSSVLTSDLPTTTSGSSNVDKYNALLDGIKSIGTIATDATTFAVNAINPSNYSSAQAQSDAKANQLITKLNDWNKTYVDTKSSDYNSEKMSYGLDVAKQIKSISGDNVNTMVDALDPKTQANALNQSNANVNKLLGVLNSTAPSEFNTTKQAEQVELAKFLDSKLGTNTSSVLTSAQNDAKKSAGSLLATVNKDYASGTTSAGFGSGLTLDNIMGLGNKIYSEGSALVSNPSKYISDKEKEAENYITGVGTRLGEQTKGSLSSLVNVASSTSQANKDVYVNDKSSVSDKLLSYVIPQDKIKDIDAAFGYAGRKLDDGNKYISSVINLPGYDKVSPYVNFAIKNNPLTLTTSTAENIVNGVGSKLADTSVGKTVLTTKIVGNTSIGDVLKAESDVKSGISQGTENFIKDQYTELKTSPLTFVGENVALYGAGKLLGGAVKTVGLGGNVAVATAEKPSMLSKALGVGDKIANKAFTLSAINTGIGVAQEGYKKGGIAGATEAALDYTKDVALTTKGFASGVGSVSKSPVVLSLPNLPAQKPGEDFTTKLSGMLGIVSSTVGAVDKSFDKAKNAISLTSSQNKVSANDLVNNSSDSRPSNVGSLNKTSVNVTKEEVAAAEKNINNVFILNPDGTASIKPGANPTDADLVALDNKQYQMKTQGSRLFPTTVAFGSDSVKGKWNPITGTVTNPVERKKVITQEIQAKTDSEQYVKDVTAAHTIGKNGEIIDAVQRMGSGGVNANNVNIISPIFITPSARQTFLADSKGQYDALTGSNKTSLKSLISASQTDEKSYNALQDVSSFGTKVYNDELGGKLVSQSANTIINTAQKRDAFSNIAKIAITQDMGTSAIDKAEAHNAEVDQVRQEMLEHAGSLGKIELSKQFTALDTKAANDKAASIATKPKPTFDANTTKAIDVVSGGINSIIGGASYIANSGTAKTVAPYVGKAYNTVARGFEIATDELKREVKSTANYIGVVGNKGIDVVGDAGDYIVAHSAKGSEGDVTGHQMIALAKGDRLANVLGIASDVTTMVDKGLQVVDKPISGIIKSGISNSKPQAVINLTGSAIKYGSDFTSAVGEKVAKENDTNAAIVGVTGATANTIGGMASGAVNYAIDRPVTAVGSVAAMYLGGEALGVGFKGAQILGKGALVSGGDLVESLGSRVLLTGVKKVAEKSAPSMLVGDELLGVGLPGKQVLSKESGRSIAQMLGKESGETVARDIIGVGKGTLKLSAKAVDPVTNIYFQGGMIKSGVDALSSGRTNTESGENLGKDIVGTATSLVGFGKGAKNTETFFETGKVKDLVGLGIHRKDVPLWMEKLEPQLGKEDIIAQSFKIEKGEYKSVAPIETTANMYGSKVPIELGKVTETKKITMGDTEIEVPAKREVSINGGKPVELNVSVKSVREIGNSKPKFLEIIQVPRAERAELPTLTSEINRKVQGVNDKLALAGDIVINAPKIAKKVATLNPVSTLKSITTGETLLHTQNASISHMFGEGSAQHMVAMPFGKEVKLGNTVLLSQVNGDRLRLGKIGAPSIEFLRGNITLPHTKEEVPHMGKIVEKYGSEADKQLYKSDINLLGAVLGATRNEIASGKFEIPSDSIPESLHGRNTRDDLRNVIKSIVGSRKPDGTVTGTDIQVAGSVSTKLQLGDFFGRKTNDLELNIHNPDLTTGSDFAHNDVKAKEVAAKIVSGMKKLGYTDEDLRINSKAGSKIDFKKDGEWDIGVELYDRNFNLQNKEIIDYGINGSTPEDFDGMKRLPLKEQFVRKLRSSLVFQAGTENSALTGAGPTMEPYFKHFGDKIDIATKMVAKGEIKNEADLVDNVNAMYAKYGNSTDASIRKFYTEKLAKNPNYNFILDHQRAPTEKEVKNKDADGKIIADASIPDGVKKSLPSIIAPKGVPVRAAIPRTSSTDSMIDSLMPRKVKASIGEEVGHGRDMGITQKKYGDAWLIGDRPVLTKVVGKGYELGGGAPKNLVSKLVSRKDVRLKASSKEDMPFHLETVRKYGTRDDVKYTESFAKVKDTLLSSKDQTVPMDMSQVPVATIPDAVKPHVLQAITDYAKKDFVKLAGSVATKFQLGDYMHRTPHDMELYADKPEKLTNHISKYLQSNGFKKDTDFFVSKDNKIWFGVDSDGRPDVAIEIFTNEPAKMGFGLKEEKATKINDFDALSLTDQIGRKYEASNIITGSGKTGKIMVGPRNAKGVKHIGDIVNIAVKRGSLEKLPLEQDTIDLVNATHSKFTKTSNEKYKAEYEKSLQDSPNFKFIRENQRFPTINEIKNRNPDGSLVVDASIPKGSATYTPIVASKAPVLTKPGNLIGYKLDNSPAHIRSDPFSITTGNVISAIGIKAHEGDSHISLMQPVKDVKNKFSMLIGSTRGQAIGTDSALGHDIVSMRNKLDLLKLGTSGERVNWARGQAGGTEVGERLNRFSDPYGNVLIRDSEGKILSNPNDKKTFDPVKHQNLLSQMEDGNPKGYTVESKKDPTFDNDPSKRKYGAFVTVAEASEPLAPLPYSALFTENSSRTNPNPMGILGRTTQRALGSVEKVISKSSLVDRLSAKLGDSDIIVKVDSGKAKNIVKPSMSVMVDGKKQTLVLGDVREGTNKRNATIDGKPITVTTRKEIIGNYYTEIATVPGAKRLPNSTTKDVFSLTTGVTSRMIGAIGRTDKPGTKYKGGELLVGRDYATVKVDSELRATAIKEYETLGELKPETAKKIEDLAIKQAKETGESVLGITPKTAKGWKEPENEMFLYMPDGSMATITSMKSSGKTISGVKIKEVTLGSKNEPITLLGETVTGAKNKLVQTKYKLLPTSLGRRIENIKWNLNLGHDEFGTYNKSLLGYTERTVTQPRVRKEILKTEKSQLGAADYQKHGPEHTEHVTKNVNKEVATMQDVEPGFRLNKEIDNEKYAELLGQFHDIAKSGEKENPGSNHALDVARTIKAGRTGDPRVDKDMTQTQRNQLARDIAYHDVQQPFSSGNLPAAIKTSLIYRTSDAAKVLSNADRRDLTRYGIKVDQNKLFNVGHLRKVGRDIKGNVNLIGDTISKVPGSLSTGISSMIGDESAMLGGNRNGMVQKTTPTRDVSSDGVYVKKTEGEKTFSLRDQSGMLLDRKQPTVSEKPDVTVSKKEISTGEDKSRDLYNALTLDKKGEKESKYIGESKKDLVSKSKDYTMLENDKSKYDSLINEKDKNVSDYLTSDKEKADKIDYTKSKYEPSKYEPKKYPKMMTTKSPYTKQSYDTSAYDKLIPTKPAYDMSTYEKQSKTPYGKTLYDKPSYDKLTYEKPAYNKQIYDKPTYDKSTYDKPTYDNALYDKGKYDAQPYELPYDKPYEKPYGKPYTPPTGSYPSKYGIYDSYKPSYEPYSNYPNYKPNYNKTERILPEEKHTKILKKRSEQMGKSHKALSVDADALVLKTKVKTFSEMVKSPLSSQAPVMTQANVNPWGIASTDKVNALIKSTAKMNGQQKKMSQRATSIPQAFGVSTIPQINKVALKQDKPSKKAEKQSAHKHLTKADMQTLAPAIRSKIIAHEKAKKSPPQVKRVVETTTTRSIPVPPQSIDKTVTMITTGETKKKESKNTKKNGKSSDMLNGLVK